MPDRDAAFLWETEALRASVGVRSDSSSAGRPTSPPPPEDRWLTLREAHEATGIPVETLRKWARRESIDSYMDETPFGVRRMVSLAAVRARAESLGRTITPSPTRSAAAPTTGPSRIGSSRVGPMPPEPPSHDPIDVGPAPRSEPQPGPRSAASPESPATPESHTGPEESLAGGGPEPETPPGTMLVPIDAWEKMLLQLGNLHEAGQQLAEARERAAKAETEATFLRERLSDLRAERDDARRMLDAPRSPIHNALAGSPSGPVPEVLQTGGPDSDAPASSITSQTGSPPASGSLGGDGVEVTGSRANQPGYTETLLRYVFRGRGRRSGS